MASDFKNGALEVFLKVDLVRGITIRRLNY